MDTQVNVEHNMAFADDVLQGSDVHFAGIRAGKSPQMASVLHARGHEHSKPVAQIHWQPAKSIPTLQQQAAKKQSAANMRRTVGRISASLSKARTKTAALFA